MVLFIANLKDGGVVEVGLVSEMRVLSMVFYGRYGTLVVCSFMLKLGW